MSFVLKELIQSTLALLYTKRIKYYSAERVKEGCLDNEKCREIACLPSKNQFASLSFFDGIYSLYDSLKTSEKSGHHPSTSKRLLEDKPGVQGASATRVERFPVTQAGGDALGSVLELSEIIGNLKIASRKYFESSKEYFKKARELATETFRDVEFRVEVRLMASKLRIASRILEGLEDPDAAVRDCLRYLKELQDIPAVQAMFSVRRDSDKGIASRLRARFYKGKRNVNVESIQMIHVLLVDFAIKFTNIKIGLLNWPMITIGRDFHHPVLEDNVHAFRKEHEERKTQLPWYGWKFDECIEEDVCALTSKGEILMRARNDCRSIKVIKCGKHELFCTLPWGINCFAVDENDNVYIVVDNPLAKEDGPRYKLLTLDSNGNVKTDRFLKVIHEKLVNTQMSVSKNGLIAICGYTGNNIYICDSTTKYDYKFKFPYPCKVYHYSLTVSNRNEIIFIFHNHGEDRGNKHFMYIIRIDDGALLREVQVPVERNCSVFTAPSVANNHVNTTILVSSCRRSLANSATTTIFCFSDTGELLHQFDIQGEYHQLLSHCANRGILLVNKEEAIVLQT